MKKPEFTKPFDLDHAMEGAPIGCANGAGAEILRFLPGKLIGIQTSHVGTQFASEWGVTGRYCEPGHFNALDLVMLPLGMIDGKPVFVGDKLEQRDRHNEAWIRRDAQPGDRYTDNGEVRWPAPAKVYPETMLKCDDLYNAALDADGRTIIIRPEQAAAIANAALRHAIDSEQVVTKERHDADIIKIGESLRPVVDNLRIARDMAIAAAVRTAALTAHPVAKSFETSEDRNELWTRIHNLDLASIIASVK